MAKAKKPSKNKSASGTTKSPASLASAELLLEIGVEELPYQFIPPALALLKDSAELLLKEQRLPFQAARTLGTPRRLVLIVEELIAHQAGAVKETMGPSKAVAFDQTGQPTRASLGFAAGQGVAVNDLQVRQTPKGEYVFAVKREEGRPTKTVLVDLLPQLIAKLSFPKAMKWNDTGVRFARPIRWLVILYAGQVLPIEVAGLKAGNRTWGHRVFGGGKGITVRDFDSYSKALERHGVITDQGLRRKLIEEQIAALCKKTGFGLNEDHELLEQAVFTTEYPYSIIGSFKDTYLDVPQEILITSMKEHQGFFSLLKESGSLAPHFIAVANTQLKDMSLVREGNERVLAARLADAKFFFDEDRKTTLAQRAQKLSQVTFHRKLGTMAQKQARVAKLAVAIAESAKLKEFLVRVCGRAAGLCKADLLTGIVGEFPSLQGIMGGYYARFDGEEREVSVAIGQHYLPHSMEGKIPEVLASQVLSIADRLDTITAFFHVGIIPTGSEDPFALRRHALAIVRILVEGGQLRINLADLLTQAQNLVAADGFKATSQTGETRHRLLDFIFERVRYYGRIVQHLRDDVMDAVLASAAQTAVDLVDVLARMKALQDVTSKSEFDPLIIGFKRAHRLTEKEQWDRTPVDPVRFQHQAESDLYKMVTETQERFTSLLAQGQYQKALDHLVLLKPAIDGFFASVMVNAEDQALRSNRLSLLSAVDRLFMSFADFSQIVVQSS